MACVLGGRPHSLYRLRHSALGTPSPRGGSQGDFPTVPEPEPAQARNERGVSASKLTPHRCGGRPPRMGPDPVWVPLPAEAPRRTGRRRLPRGPGRHTTASTACTCRACTAVAAATAARRASPPQPTLSATPRSLSTCELCPQLGGGGWVGTGGTGPGEGGQVVWSSVRPASGKLKGRVRRGLPGGCLGFGWGCPGHSEAPLSGAGSVWRMWGCRGRPEASHVVGGHSGGVG